MHPTNFNVTRTAVRKVGLPAPGAPLIGRAGCAERVFYEQSGYVEAVRPPIARVPNSCAASGDFLFTIF